MHMLKTIPTESMLVSTDEPPMLIKGNVIPVTGINPMVIPMFSNI